MPQPQIQVETPDGLRAAKVVRLRSPHGQLTQVDCIGELAVVRCRSWKSVSERKAIDPLVEDEIVLEGDPTGLVQMTLNDWALGLSYIVMFGHVQEVVIGVGEINVPEGVSQNRQGLIANFSFFVVADPACIVEPAPIMAQSYPEIRRCLG